MIRIIIPLVCLLAVAGCKAESAASAPSSQVSPASPTPSNTHIDHAAALEAFKALESWDAIIEVMHDEGLAVQWVIGVQDDGTKRHGLADSVCMELQDRGLSHPGTKVRIVDRQTVMTNGGDFRAASLGTVRCDDGQRIDP